MLRAANKKLTLANRYLLLYLSGLTYSSRPPPGLSPTVLDCYNHNIGSLGILKLNREHRYNTLTPNFVKNVSRGIESLNLDDCVKLIYIAPETGEHFSNGTDFRTLFHYKKENNQDKINQYLKDIYHLQTQVAKLNKPLMAVAPGHSYNSGAAFLSGTSYPISTLDSKISFNEATFGFVPHGGSSYYLSRMPGEIGKFLALTGIPLSGLDALEVKAVDQVVHKSQEFEDEVTYIISNMSFPLPSGLLNNDYGRIDRWREDQFKRKDTLQEREEESLASMLKKKKHPEVDQDFMEPKDNYPSLVAESDHAYKQMIQQYDRLRNPDRDPSYLGSQNVNYMNFFSHVLDKIKIHTEIPFTRPPTNFIKQIQMINRCFYSNTLEEIIENLKREDTPFAKLCLDKISQNSTLSMKLALKMLHQAKSLDFKGCLQNELNVALNKIQDKEFDLGVSEILMKPSQQRNLGQIFDTNISDAHVQSFFQPNQFTNEIDINVASKALLPTRFYYESYADALRLWVNNESTTQPEVRSLFDKEAQEALREIGIDTRDRALTQESAREAIYQQEAFTQRFKEFEFRMKQMATDEKLRNLYFDNINKELDKLKQSPKDFYELVNKQIQGIFEKAYLKKLQNIWDKSVEAQSLEKRRMYIRIKKFLLQSRIFTYIKADTQRMLQQSQSLPFKLMHLQETWDKSYRDMDHPDLQQSPLWQLSKAIGKVNLTPPELAKQFFTNPDQAKLLTLYTFDREALIKLRRDLLENPLKYEELFRKQNVKYEGRPYQVDKQKRRDEYEYWYRVLNEGKAPIDSLKYYQELLLYQEFVKGVEDKALNTLKMTVTRLIQDFEHQEGENEILEFEQEKESKRESLQRLLTLLHDQEEEVNTEDLNQKVLPYEVQDEQLATNQLKTQSFKESLRKVLDTDKELSQLFGMSEEQSENPLVNGFREKSLQKLVSLIEVTLLNQEVGNIKRQDLEERLAQILNPKNTEQSHLTQMRLIDAFLKNKNIESTLADIIKVVKPYFLHMIQDIYDEEAAKVLEAFRQPETGYNAMKQYQLAIQYPEIHYNEALKKMATFSMSREQDKMMKEYFPSQKDSNIHRELMNQMGSEYDKISGLPIEEQEELLDELTRADYQSYRTHQQYKEGKEAMFELEHDIMMQRRYNKKVLEEEYTPELDPNNYSNKEDDMIIDQMRKMKEIETFVDMNETTLMEESSSGLWLEVYGHLVKYHGLDVQQLIRISLLDDYDPKKDYLMEANKVFGTEDLEYEDIGEYGIYLRKFEVEGLKKEWGAFDKDVQERLNKIFITPMKPTPESVDEHLRQQSVFDMLTQGKYNLSNITTEQNKLIDKIEDFKSIQERKIELEQEKASILQLVQNAPSEIQEMVETILSSSSKYVNLKKLKHKLLRSEYDIQPKDLIQRDLLLKDIRNGTILKDFMQNYHQIKLDVVSLAEAQSIVQNMKEVPNIDLKTKNQIKMVLNYIDQSLSYIPNERRKQITLGEYLNKHHYINSQALSDFNSDVLKSMIQKVLGQHPTISSNETIDWQFGLVRTHPNMHLIEDKRVEDLLLKGSASGTSKQITAYVDKIWQKKELDFEKSDIYISYKKGIENRDEYYEEILKDAINCTQMPDSLISVAAFFENMILRILFNPDLDQAQLEQAIQKYTEIRLNDCLFQEGFQEKLKSNNGHIYMKVLRESIANELKLSQQAEPENLALQELEKELKLRYDLEGKYNLEKVNNTEAIGFDKLQERFNNIENNKEIAHDNVFDQLLADYFLKKRGQYKKANQLLEDLDKQFQGDTSFDYMLDKDKDPNFMNLAKFPLKTKPGFAFQKLQMDMDKDDMPRFIPQKFTSLMELDIATARAIQQGKNGLSEEMREDIPEEQLLAPEYYEIFDPRKPAKKIVEDKLEMILDEIFEIRYKIEQTMSRNELRAYDNMLAQHLKSEILIPRIKQEVEKEMSWLMTIRHLTEKKDESLTNDEIQVTKTRNAQMDEEKKVKDEDALYKFMALSGMIEKKRREDIEKTRKSVEIACGMHTFEEYYKDQLLRDSKKEPRKINEEDYIVQKRINQEEKFLNTKEKEEQYFQDFSLYQENKLEQHQRNQLYFILEQFNAKTHQDHDPLNKAQEAIREYFSDTENTFFYDKNKIQ